jgi:hypothetical protein
MEIDQTWTVFANFSNNRESFSKEFIPDIFLKPQVNNDVVENFRVIKKLLEYSYFEYKFYDVATLKSILTLEMALKIRYKEVSSIDWDKRKPLMQLIDWFQQQNYFEVYNDEYLKMIREIRNLLVHPSQHSFSGPAGKNLIQGVLDLINGLYENPELRKDRMELTTKIITVLHSFQNGVKCKINEVVYFAFNAWPGFVNNKITQNEIYFYFNPTFSIPESYLERNNWILPQVILFVGNNINLTSSSIQIKSANGSDLLITEIQDGDEKNEFDEWVNDYESYCQPGLGYFYPDGKIVDTFSYHLRQFYKI